MPGSESTSKVMSANRGRDTSLEMAVRKALWKDGIRGYRVNVKGLPGRPDIVFIGQHLAIFVHGCFWHRCPICRTNTPKTHTDFWNKKFAANMKRDADVLADLEAHGWRTMVIWECEVKDDLPKVIRRIEAAIEGQELQ